jgi:hypothetical protein
MWLAVGGCQKQGEVVGGFVGGKSPEIRRAGKNLWLPYFSQTLHWRDTGNQASC